MALVSCPKCGEQDKLSGLRRGEHNMDFTCEACGEKWQRDSRRKCGYCGSESLRSTPIPLWAHGRGAMQTPAGQREAWACDDCHGSDVTRPV